MKKLAFLTVVIVFFLACGGQEKSQKDSEKTDKEKFVLQQGDTLFFENENFRVVGQEKKEYMGYKFKIYNLKDDKTFDCDGGETDALWYQTTYNNYLLIDDGTGSQYRDFVIVNMENGKEEKRFTYISQDDFKLTAGKFIFWKAIEELPEGVEEPECPDCGNVPEEMLGYIEKWQLDLNTLEEKNLKEYKRIYFM